MQTEISSLTLDETQSDALERTQYSELIEALEAMHDTELYGQARDFMISYTHVQAGAYTAAHAALPDHISAQQLYSKWSIDLLQATEQLWDASKLTETKHLLQQAYSYFLIASELSPSQTIQPSLAYNQELAQNLLLMTHADHLLRIFGALLDQFDLTEIRRQLLLDTIAEAVFALKAWEVTGEEYIQCKERLLLSARWAQNEFAEIGASLKAWREQTQHMLYLCLQDSGCEPNMRYVNRVQEALDAIWASLVLYQQSYQSMAEIAEMQDLEWLEDMCRSRGNRDGRQELLQQWAQWLSELQGDYPVQPGAVQLDESKELEEFRQRMEKYIPEWWDEDMIEKIKYRSSIWRQDAAEQVDEQGYQYQDTLQELFWKFYGETE